MGTLYHANGLKPLFMPLWQWLLTKRISLCTNVAFLSPKVADYWHLCITHPHWKIGASGVCSETRSLSKVGAFSACWFLFFRICIRQARANPYVTTCHLPLWILLVIIHSAKHPKSKLCYNPIIPNLFFVLVSLKIPFVPRRVQLCSIFWFDIAVIARFVCFSLVSHRLVEA